MRKNLLTAYTDGSCSGNPGVGGWAVILLGAGKKQRFSGSEDYTTNNRMELMAVIRLLETLDISSEVEIFTDSQYVIFLSNKDVPPARNADLWESLKDLMAPHIIRFNWVKGHNGDTFNEQADFLARQATRKHKLMKAA